MNKLRAAWKKNPGFVVSGSAHVLAFVCLVANFSSAPTTSDQVESVPVEMITDSQFNQITNGEKTAPQLPKPQRRVDKVADLEDHKPAPPLAEARKDTPPPPSPEKANDDPGDDDKPTEKTAALPPTPPEPTPPEPTPPEPPTPPARPVEKSEAPTPPEKPDDMKPDEDAVTRKPPPRPKMDAAKTDAPKPDAPKPDVPKKVAKTPVPPKKPTKHKEALDEVAKLLDTMKTPKPASKQRAGNEAKEAKHNDFSLDKITALLDHEAPQRRASTGRQLTQLASLGSPTAHAEKLSPTMMAQIDGWLIDHYRGCWSYFGLGATQDYVPRVRVRMAPDGSLIGTPALVNPPTDPNLQSLADSAVRAVNRCNPMEIPEWFKPHYEAWRDRTVRFDPKEMS